MSDLTDAMRNLMYRAIGARPLSADDKRAALNDMYADQNSAYGPAYGMQGKTFGQMLDEMDRQRGLKRRLLLDDALPPDIPHPD